MPNSLYPGFIKVEYHSAYAPHVMILPTAEATITPDPIDSTIKAWDATDKLWTAMIDELLATFEDLYPTSVVFDLATLYTMASAEAVPWPRSTYSLSAVGSEAAPGWTQAVQLSIMFRTGGFGLSKLALLDCASFNSFAKVSSLTGQPALTAIFDEWTSSSSAWAGRDGTKPVNFIAATKTLNEKLRRAYRQA